MTWPTRTQQIGLALLLALLVLGALFRALSRWLEAVNPHRLVAILGPTATGKSALGIALAIRFGGEVVSCDSTAVYRGFDIGTDKVPMAERLGIPHHLVDVADPLEDTRRRVTRARPRPPSGRSPLEGACRFSSAGPVSTTEP